MSRIIKYWLPVVSYASFIFWVSSCDKLPGLITPCIFLDKFFHLLEYTGFGFLLARAFQRYSFRKIIFSVVLTGLFYAIIDEVHQYYVPHRDASFADIIFDVLGVYIGGRIYEICRTRVAKQK